MVKTSVETESDEVLKLPRVIKVTGTERHKADELVS